MILKDLFGLDILGIFCKVQNQRNTEEKRDPYLMSRASNRDNSDVPSFLLKSQNENRQRWLGDQKTKGTTGSGDGSSPARKHSP
jgi:hypothetical protein